MRRYSREQVLRGLLQIIRDDPAKLPEPDEPIHAHIERTGFLSDDGYDAFREWCEGLFLVEIDPADWSAFFRLDLCETKDGVEEWRRTVSPGLTYESLADWIAARAPAVSFGPAEVAGVRCAKAGAFLGVRDVARRSKGVDARFAPSTPIRGHFSRAELAVLWSRLRWMTADALPPLRTRWVDRAAGLFCWSLVGAVGGGVAAAALESVVVFLHAVSACKASWAVWGLAERLENPLPAGIETFGDLARRLAEADIPAAAG